MIINHRNSAHQSAVNMAESGRRTAISAAIAADGGSAVVAAALKAADAAFYRSVIASCLANNVPNVATFHAALHDITGQFA